MHLPKATNAKMLWQTWVPVIRYGYYYLNAWYHKFDGLITEEDSAGENIVCLFYLSIYISVFLSLSVSYLIMKAGIVEKKYSLDCSTSACMVSAALYEYATLAGKKELAFYGMNVLMHRFVYRSYLSVHEVI